MAAHAAEEELTYRRDHLAIDAAGDDRVAQPIAALAGVGLIAGGHGEQLVVVGAKDAVGGGAEDQVIEHVELGVQAHILADVEGRLDAPAHVDIGQRLAVARGPRKQVVAARVGAAPQVEVVEELGAHAEIAVDFEELEARLVLSIDIGVFEQAAGRFGLDLGANLGAQLLALFVERGVELLHQLALDELAFGPGDLGARARHRRRLSLSGADPVRVRGALAGIGTRRRGLFARDVLFLGVRLRRGWGGGTLGRRGVAWGGGLGEWPEEPEGKDEG